MTAVILKASVPKLGAVGQIVNVKPGYAFNYLLPKGLSVIANKDNLADLERRKGEIEKQNVAERALAESVARELDGSVIFLEKPVNDTGVLYGAVVPSDISDYLQSEYGGKLKYKFEPNSVIISAKIRSYGVFSVVVRLYYDVEVRSIKVVVAKTKQQAEELLSEDSSLADSQALAEAALLGNIPVDDSVADDATDDAESKRDDNAPDADGDSSPETVAE